MPKQQHREPKIEMLHVDCMDYMKDHPDNAFDLAICDPPYFGGPGTSGYFGNGYSSIGVKRAKYYKYINSKSWDLPTPEYFVELKRVSVNQIIWGANHFSNLFNSSSPAWIVWDKDNFSSTFADAELAYTSFDTAVRIFKFRWNGMLQGDMKNKERRIHRTQKPVKLYEWQFKNYAKPGDKILSTHGGSGSDCIACDKMGFDLVWMDKDQVCFDDAVKRFKQHKSQGRLDLEMPTEEKESLTGDLWA